MKKFLCYDTNDAASGKINVDSRGMLKPNSTVPSTNGSAYQQLVTDGFGNTKWEDRLAYDNSKLAINVEEMGQVVKVADKAPSWMSVDAPTNVWLSNEQNEQIVTISPDDIVGYDNGSFRIFYMVFVITEDNTIIRIHENDEGGYVFPEKGVYFTLSPNEGYVSGIASADSDTPEITWDGNIGGIKKVDQKFLPETPVFTVKTKGANKYLHDAKGERVTLEQAKSIGLNFVIRNEYREGSIIKPISVVYGPVNARFYAMELSNAVGNGLTVKFSTYYAGEDVEVDA